MGKLSKGDKRYCLVLNEFDSCFRTDNVDVFLNLMRDYFTSKTREEMVLIFIFSEISDEDKKNLIEKIQWYSFKSHLILGTEKTCNKEVEESV